MPYKKRRVYKKRKPKSNNAKVWKEINHLKRVAGQPEYKKTQDGWTQTSIPNTGIVRALTTVAEGDGYDERTGNRTTPMYLQFRFQMRGYQDPAGIEPVNYVRLIVFRWRDRAGTLPTVAEVLETVDFCSFYRVINTGTGSARKFDVLMDKTYDLGMGEVGVDKRTRFIQKNFRLSPKKQISYQDTGTTGSSLSQNHIYMLWISNVSGNEPVFQGISRYTFTDA